MRRFRLDLEYDGTPYSGWQRQDDARSVQGAIEAALQRLGEAEPLVQGAGRTDAGVHATGQVAHVDLTRPWTPFRLWEALNAQLRQHGEPVAALAVGPVDEAFHARFSATARAYRYVIVERRAPLTLDRNRAWAVKVPLDAAAMNEAAGLLTGEHDFTTFRSSECQARSPVRTLDVLRVEAEPMAGGRRLVVHARARSFLHNQVRSLAGVLKVVGEGRWTPAHARAALDARDRSACAAVAPACGLTLTRVDYG